MAVLSIRMKRYLVRASLLVIVFLIYDLFWAHSRASSSSDSLQSRNNGVYSSKKATKTQERIFIASTHWNNEIVLRSHWNTAILNLVQSLGAENVYVSVVESGSYDNTKGALIELDYYLGQLGINRTISLSEASHADAISRVPSAEEEGWVDTPRGRRELRRIPFLSRERNESLKPLATLETEFGLRFDKILFLNDVVFTVLSSLSLPYHQGNPNLNIRLMYSTERRFLHPARHQPRLVCGSVCLGLCKTARVLRHFCAARQRWQRGHDADMAVFPRPSVTARGGAQRDSSCQELLEQHGCVVPSFFSLSLSFWLLLEVLIR